MIEVNVNPKGEGHDVMVAVNGNFKELLTEAFFGYRDHLRQHQGDWTGGGRYLRRPARKGRCG